MIMHPFPPVTDLPRFEGDAIAQIWLDPFGIRFIFESRVNLYVQHFLEHREPDGTIWTYNPQSPDRPPLVLQRLLYKKIVAFDREDNRIMFAVEDGSRLTVHSKIGSYESGSIGTTAGLIVF